MNGFHRPMTDFALRDVRIMQLEAELSVIRRQLERRLLLKTPSDRIRCCLDCKRCRTNLRPLFESSGLFD